MASVIASDITLERTARDARSFESVASGNEFAFKSHMQSRAQPSDYFGGSRVLMPTIGLPVAVLAIKSEGSARGAAELSEPVYGGYANSRGEVVLFGKELAYRVDLKRQTLQLRPQLNLGAQARYDATQAGEPFEFGNKTFRRLSMQQITDICESGRFRVTPKQGSF